MTQPHLTAHTAQDQAHHSARARYLWRTVVLNGTAASSGAVQDHCVARPIWCLATVASQVECSVASGPLDACGAAATKALEPLSWHRTAEPSHVSVSISTAAGRWTALQHRTAWPSRAAAKAKAVSSPLKAASEVARDGGIATDESVQQAHTGQLQQSSVSIGEAAAGVVVPRAPCGKDKEVAAFGKRWRRLPLRSLVRREPAGSWAECLFGANSIL